MKQNQHFPVALIAAAIVSGCGSMPQNPSLTEAHGAYNSARTSSEVTNLAALELKVAGESLNKADYALSEGESDDAVNHLAYLATQQVGIAQETAKRKTAEAAVVGAGAARDQVRLEARTVEADAAKQQVAIAQETVAWQADELETANVGRENDQAIIAQQDMLLKELNAKKTERGLVITLGDVLFGTNKARLASGGRRNVEKLADFLKQYPQYKVLIEGYTDSKGGNEMNQKLSDQRAYAVRMALLDMDIGSDRVKTQGYGEEFPFTDNDTAAGRQLNRRVEIVLSDSSGNITPR